eukprot:13022609-Ditylum_brightwellii.AAC.1
MMVVDPVSSMIHVLGIPICACENVNEYVLGPLDISDTTNATVDSLLVLSPSAIVTLQLLS